MRKLILGLLLAVGGCTVEPPIPQSVILISLDTLRADHLGIYGYDRPTSPNIDALAETGIVFEQALAQASSTLPSHRSLFRSRLPSKAVGPETTLAEVLAAHGLKTAAFTGGGNVSAAFGFDQGFSSYVDDSRGFGRAFDAVEIWLRGHAEEPFFLFLHTYDIHLPYDPPAPYHEKFGAAYRGPVHGRGTLEILRQVRGFRGYKQDEDSLSLTDLDRTKIVDLYDGGILYTDTYIGRLLLLLRELGLREKTAVILFSDHGEEFWEHGSVLHSHTLYQELIHVPLIFSLPGNWQAGEHITQPVRLLDVAPTLLDLLQIPIPPTFEGRSLLSLMSGKAQEPVTIAAEIKDWRARIDYPWKWIRRGYGSESQTELFNLESDPMEKHNLADQEPELINRFSNSTEPKDRLELNPFVRHVDFEGVEGELRAQLEALGYVDEAEEKSPAQTPDP